METCPVVMKKTDSCRGMQIVKMPYGWDVRSGDEFHAEIAGFEDGIICRVMAGNTDGIIQVGVGKSTSYLCNALYSPFQDTALVFEGEKLLLSAAGEGNTSSFAVSCKGPLKIVVLKDYMRLHRGMHWFTPLDRSVFNRAPAGWCSWYHYYLNITQEEVVKNTDWLAGNLKQFGCEWIQIDDGWQGRGDGKGDNRDWFTTCKRDFPDGMKWCADYIKSKGMRPGIWTLPFGQSDDQLFNEITDMFILKDDGTSPGDPKSQAQKYRYNLKFPGYAAWCGKYLLDASDDQACEYFKKLLIMLCDEWGYDYVKIDGQGVEIMLDLYRDFRNNLSDRTIGAEGFYRKGLEAMKKVMGKERFLLNCCMEWTSCGICEGIRSGGDVKLSFEGILVGVKATLNWLFTNTIAFYTDPDVVCVREPLPYEQARMWATLLGITGQLLMTSDKMYELPEERVELLRRILPVADIHPMELYPIDEKTEKAVIDLKVDKPGVGKWDVAAAFNWNKAEVQTLTLTPQKLGLEGKEWICIDAWDGTLLGCGDGTLEIKVPAGGCQVVSFWPYSGRPQLVGTNRHITQGVDDLEKLEWDSEALTLSGVSKIVGGDDYKVRIFVPEGYAAVASPMQKQEGQLLELTIKCLESSITEWKVEFARQGI